MSTDNEVKLLRDEEGLFLSGDGMKIRADFKAMLPRLKNGVVQSEMLVKAAKLKNFEGTPKVLDATAGFGQDSILLAAAGCDVTMYEKDPVIADLLEDALIRGASDETLAPIVSHMHLIKGDSIKAMETMEDHFDVIVLDPMFPERNKSALVKKKFQLIHHLELPCEDEEAMLKAAMKLKPKKLIIKRPLKGPFLAGVKPSYSLSGKAIRYDCIINM